MLFDCLSLVFPLKLYVLVKVTDWIVKKIWVYFYCPEKCLTRLCFEFKTNRVSVISVTEWKSPEPILAKLLFNVLFDNLVQDSELFSQLVVQMSTMQSYNGQILIYLQTCSYCIVYKSGSLNYNDVTPKQVYGRGCLLPHCHFGLLHLSKVTAKY